VEAEKLRVVDQAIACEDDEKRIDKEQIIQKCWEIYFAKDSRVRKSPLVSKYDFQDWLKKNDLVTKRSNIDRLINNLSSNFSEERLESEIIRWLNINLPS